MTSKEQAMDENAAPRDAAPVDGTMPSWERNFALDTGHCLGSSRLPGFYEVPISDRLRMAQTTANLSDAETKALGHMGVLNGELIDVFIENGIGTFSLPLGVATNVRVNGKDVLVPMAVEETSVVAAASHGAKLARAGGGFTAVSSEPMMTGQIQVLLHPGFDPAHIDAVLLMRQEQLLAYANRGQDRLLERGGGAKTMTWRVVPEIASLIIHLHIHTGDAMGANIVNTMCERVSGLMPELFACDIGLRILTNLNDQRRTQASCRVPVSALTTPEFPGAQVARRIVMAYEFAFYDVYRATTNNKGIMNGIDPVLIATGNDWRAVEAGAHAYACKSGRYMPLATWSLDKDGDLVGSLDIPLAVGIVGGVTKLHPGAAAALRLMGSPNAKELAAIVASVGLAQNLSALRALASEGIQRGHMSLHRSNLDLLQRRGATRE